MAPSPRLRPAIRRPFLLVLFLLVLAACDPPRTRVVPAPEEFRLELPSDFVLSGGRFPGGREGVWYWLKGDDPRLPRLTVRLAPRRLELLDQLALEFITGPQAQFLEEGEPYDARAVNAEGLGRRVVIMPVPERDSTLVLLVDVRVFGVGEQAWVFSWQQDAGDSLLLREHETRMARLLFTEAAGHPPVEDDSLDGESGP
jgi:hypothetical protein